MQFINAGFSAVGPEASGGVAWWAHFGGFVFGILLLPVFRALPETGIRRALEGRLRRRAAATTESNSMS
jgi:membrane associated rhomboid family serine protease